MLHADVKLDTLGYFCPMPIIMTLKKIKELTLGQVLELSQTTKASKRICRPGATRPATRWSGQKRNRRNLERSIKHL